MSQTHYHNLKQRELHKNQTGLKILVTDLNVVVHIYPWYNTLTLFCCLIHVIIWVAP